MFSFQYPAGWQVIGQAEVATLLKTSLKGLKPEQLAYIGGVYSDGVDNCKGCASVVLLVVKDAAFPGSLTDEQYRKAEQATKSSMGSRLISYRKMEVNGMAAVESVHIGASGVSKLRELTVFPPEPGIVYTISCSSHKDSYSDYEAAFARVAESLEIQPPGGIAAPATATRPALTATPVIHVVKQGDTLGKIAAQYGVSLDSILKANRIADANKIEVGQRLIIPAASP